MSESEGYVYYMEDPDRKAVTIGHSYDPRVRRRQHQRGNPTHLVILGAIPGGLDLEAEWHRRFKHLLIPGHKSWYYGMPEIYEAIDRALNPKPRLFGREIGSVYLAGKITGNPWRKQLFEPGINPKSELCGPACEPCAEDSHHDLWLRPGCVPVPGSGWRLDFTGPYWLDTSCGHGTPSRGAHAFGLRMSDDTGLSVNILETDGKYVRDKCLDGVSRADLVFAWIESLDCFGSIAEITWAYSLKTRSPACLPVIVIASSLFPSPLEDRIAGEAWFVAGMADAIQYSSSPLEAWERLWSQTVQPPGYTAADWIYRTEKKISVEFDRELGEDYYAGVPFGPDGIVVEPGF